MSHYFHKQSDLENKNGVFNGDTHIVLVVDKSSSMYPQSEAVVAGVNSYITEQKSVGRDNIYISQVQFSDAGYNKWVYRNLPVKNVPLMTKKDYAPSGMTALLDGIDDAIKYVATVAKSGDRVLVIIQTDGMENDSREVRFAEDMRTKIKSLEALGNWTFVYLTASLTGTQDANTLGIHAGNTIVYDNNPVQTRNTIGIAATASASYSSSGASSSKSFFSQEDDDAAKKAVDAARARMFNQ